MVKLLALLLLAGLSAPLLAATPATTTRCLNNRDIRATRLSADAGYFAQTRQGWWHNSGAACPAFGPDRALKTAAVSDRQCKGDLVTVFHAFSRIEYGGCVIGGWEKVADDAVPPLKAAK